MISIPLCNVVAPEDAYPKSIAPRNFSVKQSKDMSRPSIYRRTHEPLRSSVMILVFSQYTQSLVVVQYSIYTPGFIKKLRVIDDQPLYSLAH
jgi:hypothetical protein